MKKFIIYEIKNKLNGKSYIGQYSGSNFDTYFGSGKLIKAAIKKHGIDNFTKTVLEECSNKEELNIREVFWIKELDVIKNGYNLREGGTGGDTSKFIDYTNAEYRQRKSEITKQYWDSLSNEKRELRSVMVRGSNNGMYGKNGYWKDRQKPAELVERVIKSRRSYTGENNPNWKGGLTFCKCGARIASTSNTCSKCRDRTGSNNSFYGKQHSEETKHKLKEHAKNRKTKPSNSKKVLVEGILYQTASDAARHFGITRGLVNYRCKSEKYNWSFVEDSDIKVPTVKISDKVVDDISDYTLDDITLENYQSHPTIKLPLSN